MILYFTGTGNSKYIADALAERLEDEVVSLNEVMKYQKDKHFYSEKPFVIVVPIYAWRLPRAIVELFKETSFSGSKKIYFVPTMGENSGKCDKYCEKLCSQIHMEFMGFRGVVMPDNYIPLLKLPEESAVKKLISKAIVQVDEIAADIKMQKSIHKTDKTPFPGVMSGCVNHLFYKFAVTDKNYTVSDSCVSCGLCESLCPVNNIKMENGRPVFQGRCMSCYSCLQRCPKVAINIKGKTESKGRYICSEYKKS